MIPFASQAVANQKIESEIAHADGQKNVQSFCEIHRNFVPSCFWISFPLRLGGLARKLSPKARGYWMPVRVSAGTTLTKSSSTGTTPFENRTSSIRPSTCPKSKLGAFPI